MSLFYERLENICAARGIKINPMAQELGISTSKTTAWKKGAVPKLDIVAKIADYFGVEMDYFTEVDGSKVEGLVPILTEKEQELLRLFRANEAKQDAILDLLKK